MIDSTCDDSGSEDSGCDGVTVLELSEEVLGVLLVLLSFLVQAVKETTVARTTAINNNFLKIFSPFNTIYPLWKIKVSSIGIFLNRCIFIMLVFHRFIRQKNGHCHQIR
jgi:hypothetical protein